LTVRQALADLPHDQVHDLDAAGDHLLCEILHAGDTLGHRHGRPFTSTVVVSRDCRSERLFGLERAAGRIAA
jgi:hypothetical protein